MIEKIEILNEFFEIEITIFILKNYFKIFLRHLINV